MFELKKTVALVGMMGSGKSAIGKVVSSIIGVPFKDADVEIEQAAKLSIPEIFERHEHLSPTLVQLARPLGKPAPFAARTVRARPTAAALAALGRGSARNH